MFHIWLSGCLFPGMSLLRGDLDEYLVLFTRVTFVRLYSIYLLLRIRQSKRLSILSLNFNLPPSTPHFLISGALSPQSDPVAIIMFSSNSKHPSKRSIKIEVPRLLLRGPLLMILFLPLLLVFHH